MHETLLRWEGRIGSLKSVAVIALIFLAIFFFPAYGNFTTALKNPSGSEAAVKISQLSNGQIGTGQYVKLSGLAAYELSYVEKENGVKKAIIYPLIDQNDSVIVFVRTTHAELETSPDANVTVLGMTTQSATDLKNLIEKDMADINSAGFKTTSALYVEEGKHPSSLGTSFLLIAAMAFAGLLSLATFFFPSTSFGAYPVQPVPPDAVISKAVKASGNFQQVKKMQPLEFGRTKRKFENSNANLFVMDDRSLGVYIHFIYTTRVYGIQVSKRETDWMVLVKPMDVVTIEPGKVYSWRERWAVSVKYRDASSKEQTVYIMFENLASQVNFANYLREKGFAVSSGQFPVTSTQTWS